VGDGVFGTYRRMVRQWLYRFGKFIWEYLFLDNRRKKLKKIPTTPVTCVRAEQSHLGRYCSFMMHGLLLQYGRKKALAHRTT
jgi:hypothetical protein